MQDQPASPDPDGAQARNRRLRLIAFITFFTVAGPVLAIYGPPIMNRFEESIGTIPTPPPRPAGVPANAIPFHQDGYVWWWLDCRETGKLRYTCRLFDDTGANTIAGDFVARAGPYWTRRTRYQGSLPGAGEVLEYIRRNEDTGAIELFKPRGGQLEPIEWIYEPSKKTKIRLTGAFGDNYRIGERAPMTDDELTRFSR